MKNKGASDTESSSDTSPSDPSDDAAEGRGCLQSLRCGSALLILTCVAVGIALLLLRENRSKPRAVLHFQFLAVDDVPHGQHWRRFFDGAAAGSWTVWLHCVKRAKCLGGSFVRKVPETRVVPSVPTAACRDMVTAHIQLLRYALRETEVQAEKFLLLSDGMLPIKPFSQVLATLTAHTESDFCIYPASQWSVSSPPMYLVQHSQAVQLSRKDARTFVASWDLSGGLFVKSANMNLTEGATWDVRKYPAWDMPVHGGNRGRQVRSMSIQDFSPSGSFCSDEVAAFSSIHGAIVFGKDNSTLVRGFGTLRREDAEADCYAYGLCSGSMQGRCFTYFSFYGWSLDDYTLEGDIAADDESVVYRTSSDRSSRPVAFGNLSKTALRELRESLWLFAKEFRPDAHLWDYEEVILKPQAKRKVQAFDPHGEGCQGRAGRAKRDKGNIGAVGSPVLHFLFLAIDTVFHAEVWEEFFAGAPHDAWNAWLHCKEPDACRKSGFFLRVPGVTVASKVRTIYCNDLLSAAVQMMKEALAATVAAPLQKFLLVSDSTLPLKPFSAMYAALTQDDTSDFCFYPKSEWLRADVNGSHIFALQHHQWIVLNLADAVELACRWAPQFDATNWPHWPVALHGRSRAIVQRGDLGISNFDDGKPSWACTDEVAPFGLLYGAFAPEASGAQYYPGFGNVTASGPAALVNQGRCRTLVLWNKSSLEAVKRQLVQDPGTTMVGPTWGTGGGSNPAAFSRFSDDALRALRASDYLFIRKVLRNASLENYGRLVLSS